MQKKAPPFARRGSALEGRPRLGGLSAGPAQAYTPVSESPKRKPGPKPGLSNCPRSWANAALDFLTMLETWEAAASFLKADDNRESPKVIGIAKLLGWVRKAGGRQRGPVRTRPQIHRARASLGLQS